MGDGPVIALVDGEHHPDAVRELLDRIAAERGLAGVAFCGGEEKLPPGPLEEIYGRSVSSGPEEGLERLAAHATTVLDLADEPPLPASRRLRLAALSLHLGLAYEAPGLRLEAPLYEQLAFDGPKLAVIGTAKRTGKTAVAGHWARLLREGGHSPVMVCMGRGGPAAPRLAEAGVSLEGLLAFADADAHAASDYLENAALAGVPAVGCRRVGGGLVGEPAHSNVAEGAALAASLGPGALLFEGSGACVPPVEVDRTVLVAGTGSEEPFAEYRALRADLILAAEGSRIAGLAFRLEPELSEPAPAGARVALFTTGARSCPGVEPVVTSTDLARRGPLAVALDRAAAERCDLYVTELKAAAVDTVARRARAEGVALAFLRHRPLGVEADLDAALMELVPGG